jgi:hypothetical protein
MFSHSRRDVNVRVMNLSKIVVEARKGDPLRMMKEIKDKMSSLQEQADKARAKKNCLRLDTTAQPSAKMQTPSD